MLINDIAGLKAQIGGVQKTMNWPTWESYVRQAELKYIIPAVGQDLYDELIAVTEPTDAQRPLLDRLKAAVAFFAYTEALPFLLVATGDAGLVVNTPGNTATLAKWMYVAVVKDVTAKADFWLEDSLHWLESHASWYPVWRESEFYTVNRGQFIASATEWTKAFPSAKNSRRLFLEVRQYLFNEEDDFIKPMLGEAFFLALKARLTAENQFFPLEESNVLRLCRKALANHAFTKALPYLNMNADFRIVSETDGIINEDELTTERLNMVLRACEKDEASAVAELTKYLNAKASSTVFPEYFASDRYRPPVIGGASGFQNDAKNPYFVL